jgi:hypothetical protein
MTGVAENLWPNLSTGHIGSVRQVTTCCRFMLLCVDFGYVNQLLVATLPIHGG